MPLFNRDRLFRGRTPEAPGDIVHDDTIRLPTEPGETRPLKTQAFKTHAFKTQTLETEAVAPQDVSAHQGVYSDERFWRKLTRFGKRAGREVALKALQLYFVLRRPDVPFWAKSTIIGALGYFISPLDAIPDFIVGVGYTDDASVLAAALVAVSIYIDEDIKLQAESALAHWWPNERET
ncbi:YkvA family protein [Salinicola sp. V024]|uniref:YkvA family protein n=1 Tax=unclassified Salinicola TaxID=2634022 RepID=UPI0009FA71EA|nr:YkvA family protein [Salinicola sp. MH3R3-1]